MCFHLIEFEALQCKLNLESAFLLYLYFCAPNRNLGLDEKFELIVYPLLLNICSV